MTADGLRARAGETLLTARALDYLSAGPAEAVPLIEHVCQLPGAPRVVAEQMAMALFAGHPDFVRDGAGRWCLAGTSVASAAEALAPAPATTHASTAAPQDSFVARSLRQTLRAPVRDELGELSYVVVDVETTGMRAWADDRVTEIAAVVVRDGAVVDRFESLVNPERPIPPMITALTQISWEMVRSAPRFRDICDELLRVLAGHVFVAHNAEFDWRFLSAELRRATGQRLEGRRLCTVRLARRILPHLRSRRLDSLAHYYGVDITARHRAGGDALATAHILLRLLDEARGRDCRSWTDLQQLLGARAARRHGRRSAMPQAIDVDTTA